MIKFNDPKDWLDKRVKGVRKAYIIGNFLDINLTEQNVNKKKDTI